MDPRSSVYFMQSLGAWGGWFPLSSLFKSINIVLYKLQCFHYLPALCSNLYGFAIYVTPIADEAQRKGILTFLSTNLHTTKSLPGVSDGGTGEAALKPNSELLQSAHIKEWDRAVDPQNEPTERRAGGELQRHARCNQPEQFHVCSWYTYT